VISRTERPERQIHAALDALDVDDVNALAKTGAQIRQWIMEAEFPKN
jgi:pyruvate,water dikinase